MDIALGVILGFAVIVTFMEVIIEEFPVIIGPAWVYLALLVFLEGLVVSFLLRRPHKEDPSTEDYSCFQRSDYSMEP